MKLISEVFCIPFLQ